MRLWEKHKERQWRRRAIDIDKQALRWYERNLADLQSVNKHYPKPNKYISEQIETTEAYIARLKRSIEDLGGKV